jgi:hypothetical protein
MARSKPRMPRSKKIVDDLLTLRAAEERYDPCATGAPQVRYALIESPIAGRTISITPSEARDMADWLLRFAAAAKGAR